MMVRLGLLALVAGALGAAVAAAVILLARTPTARDVAWLAGEPAVREDEAAVYRRYLARHRRHRLVGGIIGAAVAIVIGVGWYQQVRFGVGDMSPLADVMFCSIAGILVGALSAETFRLSEPQSDVVAASLRPRAGAPRPGVILGARVLTAASTLAAVTLLAVGRGADALVVAGLGLAMAAVAELTRVAVRSRRRPVLSVRAQVVDARIRSFADASVSWLQLAAAAHVATWVLASARIPLAGIGGALLVVVSCAGLIAVVALLWRARTRPPMAWSAA